MNPPLSRDESVVEFTLRAALAGIFFGILFGGATDYRQQGGCNVVNLLPDSAGSEASTNAGLLAGFVPQR